MKKTQFKLTDRELSTILAALRFYQQSGLALDPFKRSDAIHDLATNGDTLISFCNEEVDQLCERLNFDAPIKRSRALPPPVDDDERANGPTQARRRILAKFDR